jgi:inosose dehydratase
MTNLPQHSRREFLRLAASTVAAPALFAGGSREQRLSVGAQTNTFGVPIVPFERLLEVTGTIARLGYAGFETNVNSLKSQAATPVQARRAFEARHIRLIGAHTGSKLHEAASSAGEIENLHAIAGTTAQMGALYLVVSGARLPRTGDALDVEAAKRKAEGLDRLGRLAKAEGLTLCYHNHHQEFEDSPPEMSILLEYTDPEFVFLAYDIGNLYGTAPSPAAFVEAHRSRIRMLHIKDVKTGENGKTTPADFGQGLVDIPGILHPLLESDWKGWLTVEREGNYPQPAADPERALRQCREYLRTVAGV